MRHSDVLLLACVASGLCSCGKGHTISVRNTAGIDRNNEIVELDAASVSSLYPDGAFIILDGNGTEVPYQLTYDGKLIFPASVGANAEAEYVVKPGQPSAQDSLVYGRHVPERKDDMAWENDRSAYRAYGPALQESGEKAYGYDIWTKSVPERVIDRRYHNDIVEKISFHVDHGDGMDVYAVGPTLGGGTAALLNDAGEIVYPYCYDTYEILDNGPLRFTVRLVYGGETVDQDSCVVETRTISLDKGSYLNKTTVEYSGLSKDRKVAPGIVVHRQNPEGYFFDEAAGYMAYSDLTEDEANGNGTIFVGVVAPGSEGFEYRPLEEPAGDAVGHILAFKIYDGEVPFTYWWGSGWSKGGMPDEDAWKAYLRDFSVRSGSPLQAEVR